MSTDLPEDHKSQDQEPEEPKLKLIAQIFVNREGGVALKSPMVEKAPTFLLEVLHKACLGIIGRLGQKEQSKIIKASGGIMEMLNKTKGAFGGKNRLHT